MLLQTFTCTLFLILYYAPLACSQNCTFDLQSFTLRNFTLLGDSYLRDGVVGLTRELQVPSSSSGSFIYNNPIMFLDQETKKTASFSTRFAFYITNMNPTSYGDGLAFFLSPENRTLGSPGGFLGLANSSELTKNKFVAVEFDTRQDMHFNDPDGNHVGLDINSLVSVKTAAANVDLKSGNVVNSWIDYVSERKELCVFLSYNSCCKPKNPILKVDIDLYEYFEEFMYVGFSASTEGSTELHRIVNWSFSSFGFSTVRSSRSSHNVSDNTVIVKPPPIHSKHDRRLGWGLGIGGPAFFCAVLVAFGWVSVKKWRGLSKEKNLKAEIVTGPRQFIYKELRAATRGFHSSRIIGNGSFGTVYKAFFSDSSTVAAVKRSKHSHEGKTEFAAELSIIACLRHKNLVQLQGWCNGEKGELLLVYDFMPNGSLDKVLYNEPEKGILLKWPYRYNIAVGLASVLTYLHQECEQQVIHRDIKASNIMLDGNYNARLGDFGLARLMDHDKSPVSTLTAGTMGYLAPEYLQYGKATEKTDVFSYGVVMLELACGRRPIDGQGKGHETVNLVDWVWRLYSEGRIIEAADKRLNGEFKEQEMRKLLLVGLSCANPDSTKRPCMRRVFQILNNEADPIFVPKVKPTLTFSTSLSFSINDIFSDNEDNEEVEIRVD